MRSYHYILYEALLRQFSFCPSDDTERYHEKQLADAKTKIRSFPKEHRHTVFLMTDSLEVLNHAKACHAFSLGLSFGFALAQELEPFQNL